MSEMVERVARAIFNKWREREKAETTWEDALAGHAAGPGEFPHMHRTVELARAEAIAAIEAMREPTQAMKKAAADAAERISIEDYDSDDEFCGMRFPIWDAHEVYSATVDAALSEERG